MFDSLMERMIKKAERDLGESADWMRDIRRSSPAGFRKFLMFMPLSGHGQAATPDLLHAARMVAAQIEDCGPCLNTTIRYARKADVDEGVITDVVQQKWDALSPDIDLVCRYARAVVLNSPDALDLVDTVRHRFGDRVLTELALAIAAVRVFPTVKRALGHAQSCAVTPLALQPEDDRHAA